MQLTSIDQQIAAYKEEIERLEAEKVQAEQHEAALNGVKPLLDNYCELHNLKLTDVFHVLEKDIERWIKSQRGQAEGIHQHLKSYFARTLGEGNDLFAQTKRSSEPNIAAGIYTNPYTKEQLIKKTRAPKALREWIQIYGLGTVETWRK